MSTLVPHYTQLSELVEAYTCIIRLMCDFFVTSEFRVEKDTERTVDGDNDSSDLDAFVGG